MNLSASHVTTKTFALKLLQQLATTIGNMPEYARRICWDVTKRMRCASYLLDRRQMSRFKDADRIIEIPTQHIQWQQIPARNGGQNAAQSKHRQAPVAKSAQMCWHWKYQTRRFSMSYF